MAGSLDFMFDCLDGMAKQKQQYVLIMLNKSAKGKKVQANVAIDLRSKKMIHLMRHALQSVDAQLEEQAQ